MSDIFPCTHLSHGHVCSDFHKVTKTQTLELVLDLILNVLNYQNLTISGNKCTIVYISKLYVYFHVCTDQSSNDQI